MQARDQVFPPFMAIYEVCRPYIKGDKTGSVTYGRNREDEVSKIFIISLTTVCLMGSGIISCHAKRLQFLTHLKSKISQFGIVS